MRPCEDCDREFPHGGALAAHRRATHPPDLPTAREAWRAMLTADQEAFAVAAEWAAGAWPEGGDATYDAALEVSHDAHVAWEDALERVARQNPAA